MLIPISADPAQPDGVRQWAMIELQGEIERKDGGSLEEAFDVGTLSVSSSVSAPVGPGPPSTPAPLWHPFNGAAPPRPARTHPRPPRLSPIPAQGGSVFLTIGYHQLEGKRMPLKKPLAVLEQERSGEELSYKVRWRALASIFTRVIV